MPYSVEVALKAMNGMRHPEREAEVRMARYAEDKGAHRFFNHNIHLNFTSNLKAPEKGKTKDSEVF